MSVLERLFGPPNVEKLKAKRDIEGLIKALESTDREVRKKAALALGESGDRRAVDALIAALENQDVRPYVIEALGEIRDARVIGPLITVLKDESGWICEKSIGALKKIGAPAVEPLIAAFKGESARVRVQAARALGEIGDLRAVEPLIAETRNNLRFIRQNVAEALGKLGDMRAVEPLIISLGDYDAIVRRNAAKALGKLGDVRAIDPLIRVINDSDNTVREAVSKALDQMNVETEKRVLFPRYTGTESADGRGQCDVCYGLISPENAFLVPKEVFYASKKYKESLTPNTPVGAMIKMLGGNVDLYLSIAQQKEKRSHTAVCSKCIHMFQ